jgi:Tfp pilus assembly protein PilX
MANPASRVSLRRPARRQQGVMLFIALIVLVALTMAGISMMRSVDTATIVAGNIGFRQSAVNAADQGIRDAHGWMTANMTTGALTNDDFASGYMSNVAAGERPDWYTDPANWVNAKAINGGAPDASGNVVSFVIHRLCPVANCAANAACGGVTNVCGQTLSGAAVSGEGVDQSAPNFFTSPPSTHYRVTVRSVGPRNSVAYVQTLMRVQ